MPKIPSPFAPPPLTVADFMGGQLQKPAVIIDQPGKEVTYVIASLPATNPAAKVPFFALRRRVNDHARRETREETVFMAVPGIVSIRAMFHPILAEYPAAHCCFPA